MSRILLKTQQDWTCQVCLQGCGAPFLLDILQSLAVLWFYLTLGLFLLLLFSYPRSRHTLSLLKICCIYSHIHLVDVHGTLIQLTSSERITKGFLLKYSKYLVRSTRYYHML